MRIAYLVNQYPAISHTFIRREIQALERHGVEVLRYSVRAPLVELIAPEDIEEKSSTEFILATSKLKILRDGLATVMRNPMRSVRAFLLAMKLGWRSEAGLLRHLFYFIEALVLARWLSLAGVTHIHAHFGTNSTTVAMLAASLAGIGFSFTVHGPEEFEKPALISLPEKVKQARFTAAISSFGASQLKMHVPPDYWDQIKIVHCGLEQSFFETADLSSANAPERVTDGPEADFLCVGRLCAQKAQIDLVRAAATLRDQGQEFTLTLVGDGPMRADIEKVITDLDLGKIVHLAGWKTPAEVREALLASKVFILPSYAEGLPVSIMEALAVRKPVISTYIAGIPELILPGKCGWLVPAGDVNAIASAMHEALQTPPMELERMGIAGQKRVAARHHIDIEAAKLQQHFLDCHHQGASS